MKGRSQNRSENSISHFLPEKKSSTRTHKCAKIEEKIQLGGVGGPLTDFYSTLGVHPKDHARMRRRRRNSPIFTPRAVPPNSLKPATQCTPLLALGSGKIDTLFTPPGGALFRAFIHLHRVFFFFFRKCVALFFNRDSFFLCFMYNRTFWHQQQQNNTQSTFSAGDCMCKCVSMCCHFRSQCEIFKCFQFS